MSDRLNQQLDFLYEVDKMKSVLRQTLILDKSRHENTAEHSWHFALMTVVFFEYCQLDNVDLNRVIRMALIHDLVEIYAGDTFAYDVKGNEEKELREQQAADKIFSMLPPDQAKEYRTLWEEFDKMDTNDAKYASAIDRLHPFLSNSKSEGYTWSKHNVTLDQVYERMDPVRVAAPKLWELVESIISNALKKGYIVY